MSRFFRCADPATGVDLFALIVRTATTSGGCMLDADFWLDQATLFRQEANAVRDPEERAELHALAEICDTVASRIEEHAPSG
jgi:hypothetical protein